MNTVAFIKQIKIKILSNYKLMLKIKMKFSLHMLVKYNTKTNYTYLNDFMLDQKACKNIN